MMSAPSSVFPGPAARHRTTRGDGIPEPEPAGKLPPELLPGPQQESTHLSFLRPLEEPRA